MGKFSYKGNQICEKRIYTNIRIVHTATLTFTCIILAIGCGDNNDGSKNIFQRGIEKTVNHQAIIADEPVPGALRDVLFCHTNPSNSYAVFLPSKYIKEKNWPVIFFFDPHGRGNLPLNKYKGLAEEFQYILIGSNHIQNGMSMEKVMQLAEEIFADGSERFSLDGKRTYLCGFSGGARVAVHLAKQYPHMAGVISCGAGSGELLQIQRSGFFHLGYAGNEDFNWVEMKDLQIKMEGLPIDNTLITFNGKHEWPDSVIFANTFMRLELDGMKRQMIPQNNSLLNALKQQCDEEILSAKKSGEILLQVELCERCAGWAEGFINVDEYLNTGEQLRASTVYQNRKQEESAMLINETRLRKAYQNHLAGKDIAWWQNESRRLLASGKNKNEQPAVQIRRLLGYLSLAAYIHSIHFLNKNDVSTAEHYVMIYRMVDPENPEHYYLSACINARIGQTDGVIRNLKEAIKAGFDDINRLQADSNFASIKNKSEFLTLVQALHKYTPKIRDGM